MVEQTAAKHKYELPADLIPRIFADRFAYQLRKKKGLKVVCTAVRRRDGIAVWRITERP